jgi:tetratricopeptide (TPR) repeat protein
VDDRLRPLWDFDDLDLSDERLSAQLEVEESDAGRAEVMTQLARIAGLRGDFETGDAWIDDAVRLAGEGTVALARIDLERGRLRRSSGNPEAARPLFESAFARALEAEQYYIAVDAAHMAALAALGRNGLVTWTRRGADLAEEHEGARYWLGPLLNNLGWEYFEAGDLELALDAFEGALAARLTDLENSSAIALARYAVGKTLRALGRAEGAILQLEQAVAWAEAEEAPDGWFHEELALEYADSGHIGEARDQAQLAIPLLDAQDPSFAEARERKDRLESLAHDQHAPGG